MYIVSLLFNTIKDWLNQYCMYIKILCQWWIPIGMRGGEQNMANQYAGFTYDIN